MISTTLGDDDSFLCVAKGDFECAPRHLLDVAIGALGDRMALQYTCVGRVLVQKCNTFEEEAPKEVRSQCLGIDCIWTSRNFGKRLFKVTNEEPSPPVRGVM